MFRLRPGVPNGICSRHDYWRFHYLKEPFVKFINFSRSTSPSETRMGCQHGNLCLDVSDAIEHHVLKFPRGVSRFEDALSVGSGLETLENEARALMNEPSASSTELRRFLFDESNIVF